jgi:cephalosporin-C deacetylase-like acetyl esterase
LREEDLEIDLSIDVNRLRAGFIDFWFMILYGIKKDTVHPEALAISERLLQQIQQVISTTYDSKEGKRIKKELILTDFGEPLISRLLSLLLYILNWELEIGD